MALALLDPLGRRLGVDETSSLARRATAGVLAVALLGLGGLVGRLTAPDPVSGVAPQSAAVAPAGADPAPVVDGEPAGTTATGPTGSVNGVPVGYAATPEGAVAAATGYLLAMSDKRAFSSAWRRQAYRTMAAPNAYRGLADSVEPSYARIAADLGLDSAAAYDGSVQAVTVPLGFRLDYFGEQTATVSVWTAGWLARPRGAQLGLRGQVVTLDLTRAGGDWKLAGSTTLPLDPPGLGTPLSTEALHEMAGFTAYRARPPQG